MRYERKIGKKVWKLSGDVYRGYALTDRTEYTLKGWKSGKECGDYCNHFIIEDRNGNTTEVKEYEVIFVPNVCIGIYLSDNECYSDAYECPNGEVEVYIEWGDWKHDHLWCRTLMNYIGYVEIEEEVTEEDGSDTYSARHLFKKLHKTVK